MKPNDIAPPSTPVTDDRVYYRDETKKLSFWISQVFILLATILGVYLASSQGFRQALAYGEVQATRNNYYLRKSLQSELRDNLDHVRGYLKRLETGGLPARQAPFSLDTFVWESMKNSSSTLETPPELLRESRIFYRGVADLQRDIASNRLGVKVASERMLQLVDTMEKNVLPQFSANLDALKKELSQKGITVQ